MGRGGRTREEAAGENWMFVLSRAGEASADVERGGRVRARGAGRDGAERGLVEQSWPASAFDEELGSGCWQ